MSDSRLYLVAALAPDVPESTENDATEEEGIVAPAGSDSTAVTEYDGPPPPRRLVSVPQPGPTDPTRAALEVSVLRAALRWVVRYGKAYPDLQSRTEALDAWRDAYRAELGLPAERADAWQPGDGERRGPTRR